MTHTKKKRVFTREQKQTAIAMLRKGLSKQYVADYYKVCVNTMYRWGYELGGSIRKRATMEQKQLAMKKISEGYSKQFVADMFKVSVITIYKWSYELNYPVKRSKRHV